ncbi:MAG: DUF6371 domain-containing protein, partial [bacterium]|nr:DUF6371 domain-containing protein [bacterium]
PALHAALHAALDRSRCGRWHDRVIFWLIDRTGRVLTGKVMEYDTATLHRRGHPTWVHSLMMRSGAMPAGAAVSTGCLFGEHLLREPSMEGRTVGVVESEKSAVLLSVFIPSVLWVATGGCSRLTAAMLAPLRRRRLLIAPDAAMEGRWLSAMEAMEGFDASEAKWITFPTDGPGAVPPNTDLADWYLHHRCGLPLG